MKEIRERGERGHRETLQFLQQLLGELQRHNAALERLSEILERLLERDRQR
jgi:hypothetical protein